MRQLQSARTGLRPGGVDFSTPPTQREAGVKRTDVPPGRRGYQRARLGSHRGTQGEALRRERRAAEADRRAVIRGLRGPQRITRTRPELGLVEVGDVHHPAPRQNAGAHGCGNDRRGGCVSRGRSPFVARATARAHLLERCPSGWPIPPPSLRIELVINPPVGHRRPGAELLRVDHPAPRTRRPGMSREEAARCDGGGDKLVCVAVRPRCDRTKRRLGQRPDVNPATAISLIEPRNVSRLVGNAQCVFLRHCG